MFSGFLLLIVVRAGWGLQSLVSTSRGYRDLLFPRVLVLASQPPWLPIMEHTRVVLLEIVTMATHMQKYKSKQKSSLSRNKTCGQYDFFFLFFFYFKGSSKQNVNRDYITKTLNVFTEWISYIDKLWICFWCATGLHAHS